ncbi:MAG: hypothetical protein P857_980 [Candidatus Xenolissoclinum pacificiensis L6]|uniref:Uncharacterized protein n=1 Tax=Candidatus Xenolissoclinum pacificiensis L6 TaxID=1401685 RepID=W2V2C5_9RICK|nr:MAG: hypothetical protein P857_980 [Candidatus Xenolissoclinum pacificiensis L6]
MISYIHQGSVPILDFSDQTKIYVNPLPHVLMLTAIVVGLSTTTVGLAIIIKMKKIDNDNKL